MGHETKDAATQVAGTAGEEARKVAREASDQARHLWHQTRSDLTEQATTQQDRAAQGLRELSDQLRKMADGADDDGMARGLVDDVARRAGDAAGWLEGRDPGAILGEARQFAQRRPGTFLAVAAGLGVLAGRMSRSLVDEKRDDQPDETPSAPAAPRATADRGTGAQGVPVETFASEGLPSPHRVTQPLETDGTPAPIGSDGRLAASPRDVTDRGGL
ncbi:hypothetical protein [Oryzobacter terrae]|uniref:hypothetical protein n=1 Tax=Oryzobacter terrae TaxID=1620385 RepID=UPI00366DA31A